jgi:hypothetical protein
MPRHKPCHAPLTHLPCLTACHAPLTHTMPRTNPLAVPHAMPCTTNSHYATPHHVTPCHWHWHWRRPGLEKGQLVHRLLAAVGLHGNTHAPYHRSGLLSQWRACTTCECMRARVGVCVHVCVCVGVCVHACACVRGWVRRRGRGGGGQTQSALSTSLVLNYQALG